jgi:hypothetical protein
LTAAVQTRIVDAVRAGATREQAAAAAGIGKRTLQRWLAHGEGDRAAARFASFAAALREAEAAMVVDAVEGIQQAAQAGDWRARAWLLERRFPAEWGRRSAHELSGPAGEPLELGGDLNLGKLSDEDLEQLRELYRRAA